MSVSIVGIASAVPEHRASPDDFEAFVRKFARSTPALEKTLIVNRRTGISARPFLFNFSSPLLCQPSPPRIEEICTAFLDLGIELALKAARAAIIDWGRPSVEITHLVCTTCTATHHPGYDLYVHQRLGLKPSAKRILLHGIGCAGGLSLVRVARDICLSAQMQSRKARVLIVAVEVVSSLLRTELQRLDEEDEKGGTKPNIASTIFADGASAMIVASGKMEASERASFEVLECVEETVANTAEVLKYPAYTTGFRATLSPHLPAITAGAVPALFAQMLAVASSSPSIAHDLDPKMKPSAFDWFIHPGGPAILSALSADLDLADPSEDPTQTAPSWQIFRERGNASSASIGAVVERGRTLGGRPLVVGVAFGPGVSVEMTLLRRVGR